MLPPHIQAKQINMHNVHHCANACILNGSAIPKRTQYTSNSGIGTLRRAEGTLSHTHHLSQELFRGITHSWCSSISTTVSLDATMLCLRKRARAEGSNDMPLQAKEATNFGAFCLKLPIGSQSNNPVGLYAIHIFDLIPIIPPYKHDRTRMEQLPFRCDSMHPQRMMVHWQP